MNVRSRRSVRLREIRDSRFDGRNADLARAIKRSDAQVSQWLSGYRTITEDSARYIENQIGLAPGHLDEPLPNEPPIALENASEYTPPSYSEREAELVDRAVRALSDHQRRPRQERVLILARMIVAELEEARR